MYVYLPVVVTPLFHVLSGGPILLNLHAFYHY